MIKKIDQESSSSSSPSGKVLWISPGLTLDEQNMNSWKRPEWNDLRSRVEFANYQRLNQAHDSSCFRVVVIDEAHHACCQTQRVLIDKYQKQGCYIVGASATPFRVNEKETEYLHDLFQNNIVTVSYTHLTLPTKRIV